VPIRILQRKPNFSYRFRCSKKTGDGQYRPGSRRRIKRSYFFGVSFLPSFFACFLTSFFLSAILDTSFSRGSWPLHQNSSTLSSKLFLTTILLQAIKGVWKRLWATKDEEGTFFPSQTILNYQQKRVRKTFFRNGGLACRHLMSHNEFNWPASIIY